MSLQGDDKIYGLGGEDIIEGNGGNDIIWGDGLTKIGVIEYENPKNHGRDTLELAGMEVIPFMAVEIMTLSTVAMVMIIYTEINGLGIIHLRSSIIFRRNFKV